MPRVTDTRTKIVAAAADALRERGVAGTSFTEVLARSNGPRGSLGHHFPGGKRELISDAVRHASDAFVATLGTTLDRGGDPAALVAMTCDLYRSALRESGFAAWCPVGAVAAESATDENLRAAAAAAFDRWRSVLTQALQRTGRTDTAAAALADLTISAIEGAVLLARTERSTRALDNVEQHLLTLLARRRA